MTKISLEALSRWCVWSFDLRCAADGRGVTCRSCESGTEMSGVCGLWAKCACDGRWGWYRILRICAARYRLPLAAHVYNIIS